jgi:hypothetical protein
MESWPSPPPSEGQPAPGWGSSTRARALLACITVAGALATAYLANVTWEWFGSDADEAPIVYIPLFFVTVGVLALAVILPLVLLANGLRRRA